MVQRTRLSICSCFRSNRKNIVSTPEETYDDQPVSAKTNSHPIAPPSAVQSPVSVVPPGSQEESPGIPAPPPKSPSLPSRPARPRGEPPPGLSAHRRSSLTDGQGSLTFEVPSWAQSEEALVDFLVKGGADLSKLGAGASKTLTSLLHEIEEGESEVRVNQETGEVTRHVDLIFVHLHFESKMLVLCTQTLEDGRSRTLQRVIAEKKGPGDAGFYDAAVRGIENALCIPRHLLLEPGVLQYQEDLYGFEVGNFESSSYPGIRSIYQTHYVQFNVLDTGLDLFANRGLPDGRDFSTQEITRRGTKVNFWSWLEIVDAVRIRVKKFSPLVELPEAQAMDFSQLKSELGLKLILERGGVDVTKFGVGKAKSLSELLKELHQGVSKLEFNSQTGGVQRTVEPAFIQLWHNGRVLVEKEQLLEDGRERKRNMVLSEKCAPRDKNALETALRGIEHKLNVKAAELNQSENMLFVDEKYCVVLETLDSASYPGIPCVYRTHYMRIDILEGGVQLFSDCGLPDGASFWTEENLKGGTNKFHWGWASCDEARELKVKGILEDTSGNVVEGKQGVVAWEVMKAMNSTEELKDVLVAGGVAVQRWGSATVRKLRALLEELWLGLSTLECSPASSNVRRVLTPAFITVTQKGGKLVSLGKEFDILMDISKVGKGFVDIIDIEENGEAFCTDVFTNGLEGQYSDSDEQGKLDYETVVYRKDLTCFEGRVNDTSSFPGLPCIQRTKRLHVNNCGDAERADKDLKEMFPVAGSSP